MASSLEPKTRWRPWRWAAALAIAGLGALAAWGAWTPRGSDPEQIRQETDAALRAGRYEQAAAALARLRNPTRAITT